MSRKCDLTGVCVLYGNNVSHSQRKTRRRFEPNLRKVSYTSDFLTCKIMLKIVSSAMRTIEKSGGFDKFIINNAKDVNMSLKAKKIKKEILKKKQEQEGVE